MDFQLSKLLELTGLTVEALARWLFARSVLLMGSDFGRVCDTAAHDGL
jgi:hypothetical protein